MRFQKDIVCEITMLFLANKFKLTKQDGQLDTELVSLGIDSVQFVERMVDVEENFDFEFEDEMLTVGYFRTIGDLLEYIREVLDERKSM